MMKDLTTLTHPRKIYHNVKNVYFKGCYTEWKNALFTFLNGKKGKWSTENIDRKTNEKIEKLYNIYI